MKRTVFIFVAVLTGIIIVLASAFYLFKHYYTSVDYKKALTGHRKENTIPLNKDNSQQVIIKEPANESTPQPAAFGMEDRKALVSGETKASGNNIINILFLGLDRTEERDQTLGVYRTDSISLVSVNLDTMDAKILCIPRDTYVYIPVKEKMDKINHAYVWGGMGEKGIKSTIETVERFVKYASVDFYFAIDMEPVPDIVDDLGGIELDVEVDMKTHGYNLSKGMQKLDGQQVYQYIRWRYSGNGDVDRIKRQQKLIKAMLQELKESSRLIDSISLVLKYKKYIKTDIGIKQMIALARLWNEIPAEKESEYYIIPGEGKMIGNIWYNVPDEKKTDALLKKVFGV